MKYKSKNDKLFDGIGLLYLLFLIFMLYADWQNDGSIQWYVQGFNLLVTLLLAYIYRSISYEIKDGYLTYYYGLSKGKIPIRSIRKIIKDTTVYSGMKVARARGGLKILYNRFDDIYISPERADEFIGELLSVNPDITIEKE